MGEAAARLLTVDEFLAWDDGTDRRHQLLRGVVTMMAPPQAVHGRLVSRLDRLLGRGLQPPCEPVTEAGIKPAHRGDTYYQADLAVTCRPLERGQVYLVDPVLIVEVLSPSTAATDRLLAAAAARNEAEARTTSAAAQDSCKACHNDFRM